MPSSFVDDVELIADEIADWVAVTVNDTVRYLSPNGRPLGEQKMTPEEQLISYLQMRGNVMAWQQFIDGYAQQIIQRVSSEGVNPEVIASIHPYDLAVAFAVDYSARMEKLYRRKGGMVNEAVTIAEAGEMESANV